MGETAAVWLDHLLPEVPYRQWVLSFEGPMAVRLGYDASLLGVVSNRLSKAITRHLRRRAKEHHDIDSVRGLHPGMITVVQRFRSDAGLFVHLHLLATVCDSLVEEVLPWVQRKDLVWGKAIWIPSTSGLTRVAGDTTETCS